ncbi:MAG: GNAT family N-acetyltransferase [Bacteroides sp.]|nr:GNAT family N-acetyltransferase [Bacteroides sp.]
MNSTRLTSCQSPLYKKFTENYQVSFPVYEQRTSGQQQYAFSRSEYHLDIYTADQEEYIGFLSYWVFDSYIYIEHFAIDAHKRGTGYGKEILSEFLHTCGKTVVLEIDPVVDEISLRRLRFYQSLGFVTNSWKHIHPPYRQGYEGHSLEVISYPNVLSQEEYDQFKEDLSVQVMKE